MPENSKEARAEGGSEGSQRGGNGVWLRFWTLL